MPETMKALVKERREPGLWMNRVPVRRNRAQRRPHQDREDGHLRHRPSHLQLGRVVAAHHPVPMVVGHEFVGVVDKVGTHVSASSRATGCRARATSPAATAVTAAPVAATFAAHRRRRGEPDRLLRRVPGHPATNAFKLPDDVSDESPRSSTPTATPCTPRSRSTWSARCADHRRRPIGIMAVAIARHVGARHVVITDVNDYRLELASG